MSRPLQLAPLLASAICAFGGDKDRIRHFELYVRPVLAEHCYACHSRQSPQPQSGLRVDSRAALLEGGASGPALIPGDAEGSLLIRVLRHAGEVKMPPAGKLTDQQIDRLAAWVRQGAPYPGPGTADGGSPPEGAAQHWAFEPPRKHEPPPASNGWARTPIDRFVEARLAEAELEPAPEAPARTLVRRIHYDLIGLPPEPEALEAFVRQPTEAAYATLVDTLLASQQFGERWARHWLDLVRYADEGFQARPFAIAWPFRDWVVDAFNEDMPYDQFVVRQLAADLTGGERRHLAALGMLTLGINLPRPTDVPENLDDRIDVLTRSVLGLSVACARCHDHKFDRISQEDYYALYGIFLNSPNVLEPAPLQEYPPGTMTEFFSSKLAQRRAWLDRFRAERLEEHVREFREPQVLARYLKTAWESRSLSGRQAEALSKEANLNLYLLNRWRLYLQSLAGLAGEAFRELESEGGAQRVAQRLADADRERPWPQPHREALRLALRGPGSPTAVPASDFWWIQTEGDSNVMKALKWQYDAVMLDWSYRGGPEHAMVVQDAENLQPSFVFLRGNQHDKGQAVPRRFLSALPGPEEFRQGSGRLELARAVTDPGNPLAARVFVNRVWQHLFGAGLVRTPSDFGMRGDRPSHPELLDYLATTFVEDAWSVKRLVRRIVLSRVYRQGSAATGVGAEIDPGNRLLWRQNRVRLDFEALRDSMLAVAGRLDRRSGGPTFELGARPSSPRRTLYAYVSREEPSAVMRTFDFSNPEEHTPQRQLTTVPQQALFLLNSPFLAEQARALAQDCGAPDACVENLYARILGRPPEPHEKRRATAFLSEAASGEPFASEPASPSAWSHGTARLEPATGRISQFQAMQYRVGDRLQQAPQMPSPVSGRASLTATGGFPGDGLDCVVSRRWTAPADMRIAVDGTLNHPMGDQAERFSYSNGVRGWVVSSRRGVLATWTARGFEAETALRNLPVQLGERLDFVVDSHGDYESDAFRWAPRIEELLDADQKREGREPRVWSAADDFPSQAEEALAPPQQFAQVLLMTNEFAFRD